MEFTKQNGEKCSGTFLLLASAVWFLVAAVVSFGAVFLIIGERRTPIDSATVMIEKYRWFEATAAEIHQLQFEIIIYEHCMREMGATYKETRALKDWTQDDRERHLDLGRKLLELKRKNNELANKFNSEMTDTMWNLVDGIEKSKAAVKPIPPKFTVFDIPPPPQPLSGKW